MAAPKDYKGPPLIEHEDTHHGHPFTAEQRRAAYQAGRDKQQRHILTNMTYEQITAERREEYREHIAAMDTASQTDLSAFARQAALTYKAPFVKKELCALGWRAAFMVQRYGEEVSHWPTSLTSADRKRMQQMLTGDARELGDVRPLTRDVNGFVQLPGGTVLHGLNDLRPED